MSTQNAQCMCFYVLLFFFVLGIKSAQFQILESYTLFHCHLKYEADLEEGLTCFVSYKNGIEGMSAH